jgi:hypothetical protein
MMSAKISSFEVSPAAADDNLSSGASAALYASVLGPVLTTIL